MVEAVDAAHDAKGSCGCLGLTSKASTILWRPPMENVNDGRAEAMDYVKNCNQPDVVREVMCSGDGVERCESGNRCRMRRRRRDDDNRMMATPR